jgi:thiosulfate dehydrogenase
MSRVGWFIGGLVVGAAALVPAGAYLFARFGGIGMATTTKPLPFEETFAHTALKASIGGAGKIKDPLPYNEANLLAGARIYRENCAVCHGMPGQAKTAIAEGEFPPPPQLFQPNQMVTDDPEGITYWKVSHGIRLSGMPGFGPTLSDTERWQVTDLLKHADKLPPAVKGAFEQPGLEANVNAR